MAGDPAGPLPHTQNAFFGVVFDGAELVLFSLAVSSWSQLLNSFPSSTADWNSKYQVSPRAACLTKLSFQLLHGQLYVEGKRENMVPTYR